MSQEENTVRNKESEPANSRFGFLVNGGDGGIRTLDLTDANRTLSQLSYAPMRYEVVCPGPVQRTACAPS